ncbi:GNAT family N-acetyltransferase [Microbacterium trichothecenolyticum]|uniref:GNAT superfamily N-acetyltransferase n=1 Tax=Microbacterium trichothecenolyticum TaxID=69370 RepID=A0ABU0TUW5_MICTR|nr:GNAT family N-acetyltransferase [Microbacterium trichothecenolyticum]MDQ1123453.1 GNAT superfamily N-acetyltransferase [Microbacterium trichothecenolyticum]
MSVTVRPAVATDAESWQRLYAGYREFYGLSADEQAVERTWAWVLAKQHGITGLVAVDVAGAPGIVGLANVRLYARPMRASMGLFLDDLFTDPSARGHGVATALLVAVAETAAAAGADVVRWFTAGSNGPARSIYDRVATLTPWITYEMIPNKGTE